MVRLKTGRSATISHNAFGLLAILIKKSTPSTPYALLPNQKVSGQSSPFPIIALFVSSSSSSFSFPPPPFPGLLFPLLLLFISFYNLHLAIAHFFLALPENKGQSSRGVGRKCARFVRNAIALVRGAPQGYPLEFGSPVVCNRAGKKNIFREPATCHYAKIGWASSKGRRQSLVEKTCPTLQQWSFFLGTWGENQARRPLMAWDTSVKRKAKKARGHANRYMCAKTSKHVAVSFWRWGRSKLLLMSLLRPTEDMPAHASAGEKDYRPLLSCLLI